MATGVYLTQNDLTDRLGAASITAMTDDTPPDTLRNVILETGTVIEEYLYSLYDPTNLANCDWVKQRAVDIGAYLLCADRGNPPPAGVQVKYDRAIKKLEKIQMGASQIPNCIPRKAPVPRLSAVRIRMDPFPRPVVERGLSTGNPSGYSQFSDQLEGGFDYSIVLWPLIGVTMLLAGI